MIPDTEVLIAHNLFVPTVTMVIVVKMPLASVRLAGREALARTSHAVPSVTRMEVNVTRVSACVLKD